MSAVSLPQDFLWGFATASYQIEGAAREDGRADSIWDTFCRRPGKIADGTNGDIACDSYHRIADDIRLLKSLGARVYRLSISWSRVIPQGGRNDPVNIDGLRYYERVVDALLAANIVPFVTLFHWDLPQALHDRYGGFLNQEEFVQDYARYARVMFETLGDRVRHWITFNEPWCISVLGYGHGVFAPGRGSDRTRCEEGDTSLEPWRVSHSVLVAHGTAVKMYREDFKPHQNGQIGITLNGDWAEPWDERDPRDAEAAQRKMEFSIAWFADPIYHGDYPASMRQQLAHRLPSFTPEERALVHGSNDFYGMNSYTADYVQHSDEAPAPEDVLGNVKVSKENCKGESIGPETQSAWLRPNARGFRKLINWISNRYNRPVIYITENGTSVKGENDLPRDKVLEDEFRVQYYRDYIRAVAEARSYDGVDVRGYMAWSLLDNFEWADGYASRFGVTYVDFANGQTRHPKRSAEAIGGMFATLCAA